MDEDTKKLRNSEKRRPPRAGLGRPKGAQNKLNRSVKEMVVQALESAGGLHYLATQAQANPAAFLSLVGKLIPAELRTELAGSLTVDRQTFDAIMERALIIKGGLPDWEVRLETQIGRLFLRHQRGETFPDPLVIGGLECDERG